MDYLYHARRRSGAPVVSSIFNPRDRVRLNMGDGPQLDIIDGPFYVSGDVVWRVGSAELGRFIVSESRLTHAVPEWRRGDVIVVSYPGNGTHTYVRGREAWPVDDKREPKTDAWVNDMYRAGRVRPVLRRGGVAWDEVAA